MRCLARLSLVGAALLTLNGCNTLKGADDALLNLVGKSTHSNFQGRYLEQTEVRHYYRLDPQQQDSLRLSYDGRAIPAVEIRQQNLVAIPELQGYLQGIVSKLGKGWPGELPDLQVRIVDSFGFGPSADPYGNLFVPLGMLDNVESEDEIAAMLSHEMSHVLLRHHDRQRAFQQQKELMSNLATTMVVAAVAADTGVDRGANSLRLISKDPLGTQKTIGNTVLYSALLNSFSDNVWSTAWGRGQEDQADLLGADLMVRANYAPRAASHSLQRLNDFQGKHEPLLNRFLSARKTAMQDSLKQLNLNRFTQELETFLNQGLPTTISTAGHYLSRSHMSPLDRDEDLRQYLQREYRNERRARIDKRSWSALRQNNRLKTSLEAYKNAYAASVALEQQRLREAQKLIERAIKSPVGNQPGIRRTAFSVHLAQGNSRKALADLQAINDWSLASPSVYELLINYHLKRGDSAAALGMIDKAERHFGSEELFITEKLLANLQMKNQPQVQSLLKKCAGYQSRKANCEKLAPPKAA